MSEFRLEEIDIFRNISVENIKRIEERTTELFFELGETIFCENDPGDSLFIVVSGKVGIYKNTGVDLDENVLVAQLFPGQYFGEMALFKKDSIRNASVIALTNTSVIKIEHSVILGLMKNRNFSMEIMSSLADKIDIMNKKAFSSKGTSKEFMDSRRDKSAKIISFTGLKDGLGKTTNAAILAEVLASKPGCWVLLLDLDLVYDDLNIMYNQLTVTTVEKLILKLKQENMRMAGDLDFDIWSYFTRLKNNLFLLPSVQDIYEAERISGFDIQVLIKSLKKEFDFIVVDVGCNLDEVQHEVLLQSDLSLFQVSNQDIVEVKNSTKLARVLLSMGINENSVLALFSFNPNRKNSCNITLPFRDGGTIPYLSDPPRIVNEFFINEPEYKTLTNFWVNFLQKELEIDRSNLKKENYSIFSFGKDKKATEEMEASQTQHYLETNDPKPEPLALVHNLKIESKGLYLSVYKSIVNAKFDKAFEVIQNIATVTEKGKGYYKALTEYYWWVEDNTRIELALKKYCSYALDDLYMKARLKYYSGRKDEFAEMVKKFKTLADSKNHYADFQYQASVLCMLNNELEQASKYLAKATRINPNYLLARIMQVKILHQQKRYKESIKYLQYIPQDNPFHIYYISQIQLKDFRYKSAYQTLLKLSEMPQSVYFKIDSVTKELGLYLKKLDENIKMYESLLDQNEEGYFDIKVQLLKLYLKNESIKEFRALAKVIEKNATASIVEEIIKLREWAARLEQAA
ncbi:cyclic nucleotide-binding domain-containing protein [Candidatus Riflebacteria bacterium]